MFYTYWISDFIIILVSCVLVPGMAFSGSMFTPVFAAACLAFLKNYFLHGSENKDIRACMIFSISDAVRLVPVSMLIRRAVEGSLLLHGSSLSTRGFLSGTVSFFLILFLFDAGEIISGMLMDRGTVNESGEISVGGVLEGAAVRGALISLAVSILCGGTILAAMALH